MSQIRTQAESIISPISVIEEGILIDKRDVHSSNVALGILFKEDGIITSFNLPHLKKKHESLFLQQTEGFLLQQETCID